ncbi:hypothetical protein [Costertonia aggregata]|uniref:LSU ribosomal protein L21p n=1 Tax=Costertonia aggregata TaxID=343403 RepID=A0A7H9AQ01_9FLAO|nr:hypothetical protein [Costertonia aggregata]QLG45519.1 hypothetical protein HYG79_09230 [Costertonia aggregata]
MDFENMNIWCWIIPLLCTLLGALFGYLLGKGKSTTIDNSADIKILEDKNAKLKSDLDACLASKSATPASSLAAGATVALIPFDAAAAKAAFGKNIKQDDLKIVEGIGPKIEGMFKDAGIKTWKALSEASVAECQKVLDGGGDRYKIHDPSSWPMQAKMAYEGKWKDLVKWQDEHDHGKL